MNDTFYYISAAGCSVCYAFATILEQIAAKKQKDIKSLNPKNLIGLFNQLPYVAGIVLDLAGGGLFLLASRALPLFLVFSFVAFSLVITAVINKVILGNSSSNLEKLAIVSVVIGIILLAVVAEPTKVRHVNQAFVTILELSTIPIGLIGFSMLKANLNRYSGLGLGALAGLSFGATGLISRVVHFSSLKDIFQWLILALVVYGALSLFFLAAALQRASVNKVNSFLYAVELPVPSLLGIAFLGDEVKNGEWPLMVAGFIFVIVGTVLVSLGVKEANDQKHLATPKT